MLAWRARAIVCAECLAAMPINGEVLEALREQAAGAVTATDRLMRVSASPR